MSKECFILDLPSGRWRNTRSGSPVRSPLSARQYFPFKKRATDRRAVDHVLDVGDVPSPAASGANALLAAKVHRESPRPHSHSNYELRRSLRRRSPVELTDLILACKHPNEVNDSTSKLSILDPNKCSVELHAVHYPMLKKLRSRPRYSFISRRQIKAFGLSIQPFNRDPF